MGEVIYSATPFQTFIWAFILILLLVGFGVVGVLNGIFRRKEKSILRIVRGCAGIFLCLIGAALAFVVVRSITSGEQTIMVHLEDKQIAKDNCNNGDTCLRYVLETTAGTKLFDMDVSRSAYEKAQLDSCYQVTYFSGKGFFSQPDTEYSYQSISNIRRIQTVRCPSQG